MALSNMDTAGLSPSVYRPTYSIPPSASERTFGASRRGGPASAVCWLILFAVTAANFLAFSLGFVLTRGFPRAFRAASARIVALERRATSTR